MAQPNRYWQFLEVLRELSGTRSVSDFAKACGKAPSNMTNYLAGRPKPGQRFLRGCLEHLYGWNVLALKEIDPMPERIRSIPTIGGVYVIYDSGGQVLYLGKATNFRAEVAQALKRNIPIGMRLGPNLKKTRPKLKHLAKYISLYAISSKRVRHNYEALLLRIFANQTHNSNIGRPL